MAEKKVLVKEVDNKEIDKDKLSSEISIIVNEMIDNKNENTSIDENSQNEQNKSTNKTKQEIVIDSKTKLKIILFTILTLGVFYILLQKELKARKKPQKPATKIIEQTDNNKAIDTKSVSTKESFDDIRTETKDIEPKTITKDKIVSEKQNEITSLDSNNQETKIINSKDDLDKKEDINVKVPVVIQNIESQETNSVQEHNTEQIENKSNSENKTIEDNNKNINKTDTKPLIKEDKLNKDENKDDSSTKQQKATKKIATSTKHIDKPKQKASTKSSNAKQNKQQHIETKDVAEEQKIIQEGINDVVESIIQEAKSSKHVVNTTETKSSDEMISIKDSSNLRHSSKIPVDINQLIKNFGGIENITNVENSLSTVQVFVKDKNLVNKDEVKKTINGKGISVVGQKYSLVCGDFAIALKEAINEIISKH